MGCCSALSEGDMEDDGGGVVAAALRDDQLAAWLLIRLSRPEAKAPAPSPRPSLPKQPPELTWGRKGSRSRTITREGILAAEKEEATRASPTTPLSWSGGGSGTSGSVCGGGAQPQRRKRPRGDEHGERKPGVPEKAAEGKRIRTPPAKSPKPEPFQDGEPFPTAFGSATSSAPSKVVEAPAAAAAAVGKPAPPNAVAYAEPLRWRLSAEATGPVGVGRPGKKKTLAELQAMRESLMQEQEGFRKELEEQKVVYSALFEENIRLKKLESSLSSQIDSRPTPTHVPCEEAKLEQPQLHVESAPGSQAGEGPCTASAAPGEEGEGRPAGQPQCPAPGLTFLFDLNCVPDDDL